MTAMKKVAIFMPSALSALLLWAAFPPLGETANVAFALVPLLVVARLCSPKRSKRSTAANRARHRLPPTRWHRTERFSPCPES